MAHQLVLLGGGYGGMYFLRTLLDRIPEDVEITLIDRLPKSPLKTEFYSMAAGTASLSEVTLPFPSHPQLRSVFDEVLAIDREKKVISLREMEAVRYDTLVVALGCVDRYHGIPGAAENAYSVQSLKRAQTTGQAVLTLDAYRSVVLIGAGLTGIELAAELRESRPDLNLTIVDRNDKVLKGFSDDIRDYVENWLIQHGVTILHNYETQRIEADRIVGRESDVPFDRLVWTAGIQANPLMQTLGAPCDSIGRARVNGLLQLQGDPSVFVLGDCAASEHSPSAQLAEFHGEYAASTLLAIFRGREPEPRDFQTKGTLGSLGQSSGFGDVKGLNLSGRVPRLLKSGVLWQYKRHVEK